MKKLALIAFIGIFVPLMAMAQSGARYDSFASTIVSAGGINNVMQVIPGAKITVCNFPGTGGTPCTNLATTYTDQNVSVACNTSTQVVLQGTNTCVANGDAFGNFGFWVKPNFYTYCISGTGVTTQCYSIVAGGSTSAGGGLAAPPGIGLPVRFSYNFGRSDAIQSGIGHGIGCSATQANTFNATSTETSARLLTSTAVANTQTVIGCGSGAGANPGQGFTSPGTSIRFTERLITQVTSNFRYWIGILDASGAEYQSGNAVYSSDTPNRNYCAFRLSAGTDTTWKAVCATSNTLQTVVDTGVSPSTTASFVWEITFTPTFAPTQANFFINGTQVATITTNLPATSANLSYGFMADNKNTATAGSVAYFYTQFFEK